MALEQRDSAHVAADWVEATIRRIGRIALDSLSAVTSRVRQSAIEQIVHEAAFAVPASHDKAHCRPRVALIDARNDARTSQPAICRTRRNRAPPSRLPIHVGRHAGTGFEYTLGSM